MKKLIVLLLTLTSLSSFAGVGSTMDFQSIAIGGYTRGCEEISGESSLMQVACALGANLKKAGITENQLETVLDALPEFKSICAGKAK